MQSTRKCCIDGCENPFHGRGMCRGHYMEWWRGYRELPDYTPPRKPTKRERFLAKVDKTTSEYGCWFWTANTYNNGYSQFQHEPGHRYSYREFKGEIPDGYEIDHLCMTRICVNPDHLEAVTPTENNLRGYSGNVAAARMIEKSKQRTHCARGHEFTEDNEYRSPGNPTWRVCRKCKGIYDRARKKRLRDEKNLQ